MTSNLYSQQYVSESAPIGAVLGDEWVNSKTGKLYKQTMINGVVSWVDISPTGAALGTPTSGNLVNCTGYTFANLSGVVPTWNQNTTGTAQSISGTLAVAQGGTGATATTGSGNNVLSNNPTIVNATITNYTESVVGYSTVVSAATLSLTNGTVLTATLTASTACTFTMPAVAEGKSFILMLKQAAGGNGSATFTNVKWGTLGAPTISTTGGKMDILTFVSDGVNWYGNYASGFTP